MKIPPQPIAALRGDPRWTRISPFASYAPVITLSLTALCVIQICLGAVWLSRLDSDLQFVLVLQPLVLPCLSLFNTIPSLHLHLYSRTNNPLLASIFSAIYALLYLASALLDLIACSPSPPLSSLRSECPRNGATKGPDVSQDFWNANIGLWFVSFVGYVLLACIGWVVYRAFRRLERVGGVAERDDGVIRTRGIGEGRRVRDWEEEMLTEEQREARIKEAEERWRRVAGL
ncbi:hypothetical protein CC78DRAFT_566670 [Lojkania enalia]|uniref:Uncharacterized protein n=1 Tax=Lojkania enalia TaxID=147567 RepID=A0A9P4KC86_9PLEO|nr:hypothetical protein CC78DRAFT_566670 [Didymosphaeria enalia]